MRIPAIRLGLGGLAAIAALALGALPAQASTVGVQNTTLEIDGDANDDAITVSSDGTTLTVVDTGTGGVTEADTECVAVNAQTVTCTINNAGLPPVNGFSVELNNGTDSFTNQNFVTLNGSVDSDDPGGGPATGVKTIVGGPGNQFLAGGLESDSISGGEGDDRFFDGGIGEGSPTPTGGNDILDGGPGSDSASYSRNGTAPLSLSLDNTANDGQAGETDNLIDIETIIGGSGNDTLTGNALANQINGGSGNDVIAGQGGNDLLFGEFGGSGQIRALRGGGVSGPSNDTLVGGDGRDGLTCGVGADIAIRDSRDEVDVTCERIGADLTGDSAAVTGKKQNKTKVELTCPESEGAACAGRLKVTANDKKVGKGSFSVAAGESKRAKVKLTKKGVKALKKANGSLLVSVEVLTDEPGGVSQSVGTVLLFR